MLSANTTSNQDGFYYFRYGFKIMLFPGIKRYVLVPLLVNFLLLGGAGYWLVTRLNSWIPALLENVPSWLHWLNYLLWPLALLTMLLVMGYLFSTLASIIASPFCGLLAEKVEQQLTGVVSAENSWSMLIRDLPRMLYREWQKVRYYLPRMFAILLLHFIPGVGQILFPIIWFLFGVWMMSIQYCDYPFDNHRISFTNMRRILLHDKHTNLQFGAMVSLCTLLPIINLVIMPAAVCGATAMWVARYQENRSLISEN
jgi:CysZ protein